MFKYSFLRKICFFQLAILCGAGQSLATAATSLKAVGTTELPFSTAGRPPGIWSGGAFMAVDDAHSDAPILRVLDENSQVLSEVRFTVPGARLINIYYGQFARGLDGSLALAGSAYSADDRGAVFLAFVSTDGQQQTIVRTYPFIPQAVTVASDGTVWTAGREVGGDNIEIADYNIIRRYSRTGQLLGSFVPRSSLVLKLGSLPPADYSRLVSSRDRIGWYSQVAGRYIEFSPNGSVTNEFPTVGPGANTKANGLALCDNGSLFVSAERFTSPSSASKWAVFALDRDRGVWDLAEDADEFGMLYGCNGNTLATRRKSPQIRWLSPVTK